MAKRKRSAGGQFGPEDFVPQLPWEKYANIKKVKVTFGADSSVAVKTQFSTGMSVAEMPEGLLGEGKGPAKWVLMGGDLAPYKLSDIPGISAGGPYHVEAQLLYGKRAALADGDSTLLVARVQWSNEYSASGMWRTRWPIPLDILVPGPLFAQDLSVVMQSTGNTNDYNGTSWLMRLVYGWAEGQLADVIAELQQRGT